MSRNDTYTLFLQALNVVNSALAAGRYLSLKRAIRRGCDGEPIERIGVLIYEPDSELSVDQFTISLRDRGFVVLAHELSTPDVIWKVSSADLQRWTDHPELLIRQRESFDLENIVASDSHSQAS